MTDPHPDAGKAPSAQALARNVLLADPDPMWGRATAKALQSGGWTCFLVQGPEEAILRFHQRTYDAFVFSAGLGAGVVDSLMRDVRTRYFRTRVVLIVPVNAPTRGETWRFLRELVILNRPCSLQKVLNAVNRPSAARRLKA